MNTAKFKYLSGDTFPYQPYPFQCPSGADNHILGLLSISPHLSDKHILVVGSHVPGGEVAETWLTGFVGAGSKQAERRCPTDPDPPDFGGGGLEGWKGGRGVAQQARMDLPCPWPRRLAAVVGAEGCQQDKPCESM